MSERERERKRETVMRQECDGKSNDGGLFLVPGSVRVRFVHGVLDGLTVVQTRSRDVFEEGGGAPAAGS